ncbi:MAG: hydroxyethylthiazole kinase [Peptostreptococcaceae bacterium]|nr:hydroxyethylthiazole kinase [Peptostreptococcaceae bacterium]
MKDPRALCDGRRRTKENRPLIHCITNPISIKGCANIVLAVGASPIMAEHPLEVEEITQKSDALALNLGNITDARIGSMQIAAKAASREGIPIILDLVGVGASKLRLDLAKKMIDSSAFSVLKGNMSEIKAMLDLDSHAVGIDAGAADKVDPGNMNESIAIVRSLAEKTGAVVVATGKYDIVSDDRQSFVAKNGTAMLSNITGTGCMLTALIAAYLPSSDPIDAALLGCLVMGISGELAEQKIRSASPAPLGSASFETALIDSVFLMEDDLLIRSADWERK